MRSRTIILKISEVNPDHDIENQVNSLSQEALQQRSGGNPYRHFPISMAGAIYRGPVGSVLYGLERELEGMGARYLGSPAEFESGSFINRLYTTIRKTIIRLETDIHPTIGNTL